MVDIYEMLCVAVPCFLYQFFLMRKGKKIRVSHIFLSYLFIFYLFATLFVTDIGSIWDIGQYSEIIRVEQVNIRPFDSEGCLTYVLNIIMFVPFGFLLPLIWEKDRNLFRVLLKGFCFSFVIEFCQLFNMRISDLDDLMMNTLGAGIGYFIWWLLQLFFVRFKQVRKFTSRSDVYVLISVLGRFFLFNYRFIR